MRGRWLFAAALALAAACAGPPVEEPLEPVGSPEPVDGGEASPAGEPSDGRTTPAAPGRRRPGRLALVTSVADGDTVHVLFKGKDAKVRLIGVDAPELPHFGMPGECFGEAATEFARRRLGGRHVRLELDVQRLDSFGRTLAYVHVGRKLFNRVLVAHGYALAVSYPPNLRHQDELDRADAEARAAGRGLWTACPA